jgi:hypothetical protein
MWEILFFRVFVLILGFGYSAWRWGDWKNWEKYYPTVLFMLLVNMGASFITYHHGLWNYSPDALVKSQTVAEVINCFVILPSVAFLFISIYPSNSKLYQCGYIALWVLLFSGLEFTDHYVIGGIYYTNGWSWLASTIFDVAIFSILRLHYLRPFWAWLVTFLLAAIILVVFNFGSAEMK